MPRRVHFLNVKNGDCSIIQHGCGHISVIDVSCARLPVEKFSMSYNKAFGVREARKPVPGNFDQKSHPDNPILYMQKHGITDIFRFILTHPDMDHLDGICDLFTAFPVGNFWDTANTKEISDSEFGLATRLRENWNFYQSLRSDPRRRVYESGDSYEFFKDEGMTILSPTAELVRRGNVKRNWNDSSYVIMYRAENKKIVFGGDSEDETWKHILANWKSLVSNVDILIAPHHGRKSGRDYSFLSVLKPKLTLFGNASSDHLMYDACRARKLPILTNNQAGYIVLDIDKNGVHVYVKHEGYARSNERINTYVTTWHNKDVDGWYVDSF